MNRKPEPVNTYHDWLRFTWANLKFLARGGLRLPRGHRLRPGTKKVPSDFFGICVASSEAPECDGYVIDGLRDLGIEQVRLDIDPTARPDFRTRFLERLLDEGFGVCLHLVQPREAAQRMPGQSVQDAWRNGIAGVLDRYGARLEWVEIGSTCNRRKWSGYSLDGLITAWRIAHQEAVRRRVTVAAPNVTDFEPVYNIGLLDIARREGILPDIHSTNLFAERATEPEAYDHKILGRTLAPAIRYNTIKKATLLHKITRDYGIAKLMCGHVAWSARRIRRHLHDVHQKQADYLQRYLCLMAASGTFDRVYWGPMIGQREGIIDDGTHEYPDHLPHVAFYGKANGKVEDYARRPAFLALKTTRQMLAGSRFVKDHSLSRDIRLLEFTKDATTFHAVWTTNAKGFDPQTWYPPSALNAARAMTRDGDAIRGFPHIIGERPVFLVWTGTPPSFSTTPPIPMQGVRFSASPGVIYLRLNGPSWRGVAALAPGDHRNRLHETLQPNVLESIHDRKISHDRLLAIWEPPTPGDPTSWIVVERTVSPKHHFPGRRAPSGALHCWNTANERQRRGLATPRPLAYVEDRQHSDRSVGYFVSLKPNAHAIKE